MPELKDVKFSMKALINADRTEVLFAEVDSDLADVLLSFLTLPLAKIQRLLKNHYGDANLPKIGSLNTLIKGLENLDNSYFRSETGKKMLLNPRNSANGECRKLRLNIDDTDQLKYFTCDCRAVGHSHYDISFYPNVASHCGKLIRRSMHESSLRAESDSQVVNEDCAVFTNSKMSFIISDDLQMLPNMTGSIIEAVKHLGITDAESKSAKQMTLTIGFNEIMDLLRGSLLSRTPLTDLVLHKSRVQVPEPFTKLYVTEKQKASISKRMVLKLVFQKSTQKFLFAQTQNDFIDFIFSFLTIPLGQVESLLGSNASLGSIDNLYMSISNLKGDKHLKSQDIKDLLLKPKLPPKYLSKNQLFPLTEQVTREMEFCRINYKANFLDPKGEGIYVNDDGGMFMVTDDLTVTPLRLMSSISKFKELNISLSDVEEFEITIGLEEGLNILKASLSSTNALSNLLKTSLMKKPVCKKPPKSSFIVSAASCISEIFSLWI